ncbi:MAG: FMN-binding glutamate synthase family protein [Chitinophagales bacterium]
MRNEFIVFSIVSLVLVGVLSYFFNWAIWSLIILLPIIILGYYDFFQKKHAIMRNYPILGRGRYIMEELRPKIYQYFIEGETDGAPISRMFRSVIYQRAKKVRDTTPFGTQTNLYAEGYEWMNHSLNAKNVHEVNENPRVIIGGSDCTQAYSASIFNVSAMSFGSLSSNAIEALNGGAKIGGFAHNTGEGGLSPYHLKHGGDIIWQIGTGYFGCRKKEGGFSEELFQKNASKESVKMIEIKLSQGAKPGHGGILPASKVTEEIAEIRNVPIGENVLSPPSHTAFNGFKGMLHFIKKLRTLSGGKPIGIKLCIGVQSEFLALCKEMIAEGIKPDFISVDGGEGGTGAAPLEFANSMGMPYIEGLAFTHNALVGFGIREEIKIIASGKIINGFHMARAIALGADACYSARAMMIALGCIQALECNTNKCPTGVATQDKELSAGLNVKDKKHRVANYQKETIHAFLEMLAASGLKEPHQLNRTHIYRRISMSEIKRYDQLYKYIPNGSLLSKTHPEEFALHMSEIQVN